MHVIKERHNLSLWAILINRCRNGVIFYKIKIKICKEFLDYKLIIVFYGYIHKYNLSWLFQISLDLNYLKLKKYNILF